MATKSLPPVPVKKTPHGRLSRFWLTLAALGTTLGGVGSLVALAFPLPFPRADAIAFSIGGLFLAFVFSAALVIAMISPSVEPREPDPKIIVPHSGNPDGVDAGTILISAFEYARETAGQAMEHRLTIVNFYLLIVGGAGSAIGAILATNTGQAEFFIAAIGLLWIISLIGWLTLLKLIRLRAAWIESATEMNFIRAFYQRNAREMSPEVLGSAFTFSPKSTPAPYRPWNVYHLSALLVALLDSAAFLGGFVLLGFHLGTDSLVVMVGGPLAIVTLLAHMWVYDIMLKPRNRPKSAPQATVVAQPTSFQLDQSDPNMVLHSREVFKGKLLTLHVDDVRLPSGKTETRELVEHGPSVVIVPYLESSDEIIFVEQYRDAIKSRMVGLPAGMITHGETPESTARRELLEETGYEAGNLRLLGSYYTSPGFTNEIHHLYLATGLKHVSDIQDTDEICGLRQVLRVDAQSMIDRGELLDGKSILGLQWSAHHLPTQV